MPGTPRSAPLNRMLKPYQDNCVKRFRLSVSQVVTRNSDLVENDLPDSLLLMKSVPRHICGFVLFAFVAMIIDAATDTAMPPSLRGGTVHETCFQTMCLAL